MSDDLVTTAQAAARLGLSPIRIRQFIADGRLAAHKVGRDWLIERAALEALPARKAGWAPGRPRPKLAHAQPTHEAQDAKDAHHAHT